MTTGTTRRKLVGNDLRLAAEKLPPLLSPLFGSIYSLVRLLVWLAVLLTRSDADRELELRT